MQSIKILDICLSTVKDQMKMNYKNKKFQYFLEIKPDVILKIDMIYTIFKL